MFEIDIQETIYQDTGLPIFKDNCERYFPEFTTFADTEDEACQLFLDKINSIGGLNA